MLITVVTPSFNQCAYLRQTLDSILSQTGPFDVECLVFDAGSTDGSVDLLASIKDPRLTWTSGPDGGQSNAINKGLTRARGDVVAWLNSDDVYTPGALATVAGAFVNSQTQWLVGRYAIVDEDGRVIRPLVARYKDFYLDRYSYRRLLRENFISQPAVFWRRDFGARAGPLDESLHYTMDYDLWLRMGKLAPPTVIDDVLAHFRLHGQSKSGQVTRKQFDEEYQVACRYFDGDWVSRFIHRFNVEKIVWAYRLLRLMGR